MDANVDGDLVRIALSRLKPANARGGKKVSRYKINPIFFLRDSSVEIRGSDVYFSMNAVRQLNPSITAKMNFKGLDIAEVRKFYEGLL
jgi:hypothetical protein